MTNSSSEDQFLLKNPALWRVIFYCLLAALLVPIWAFTYFPSADGPSHLFNAYVFLNYDHVPIFQQVYTLHVPTAGNLAGHGLAILFLKAGIKPEAAEKLLVNLCLIGLAVAFDYAISACRLLTPLASFFILPFLYNWPLQMGFWSFNLGVPFLFVCIGLYLRHHGRWNGRSLIRLFFAAGAAYVCHPIDWAICALTVAVMAVIGEGRTSFRVAERRTALLQIVLPIVVFLPFAIPNLLFAEQNSLVEWQHFSSFRNFIWPLYTASPLHLFPDDSRAARLLFVVLLLSSFGNFAWRVRTRRFTPADTLVPVFLILLGLGLISPGRIGEGTFIAVRLFLFGFIVWALWLALTLPRRAVYAGAAIALIFTGWLVASRMPAWRAANRSLAEVVKLGRLIPPDAFVCQLDFLPQVETVRPLDHAVDLLARKDIVDIRDYEAGRNAFWTRFRPGYFFDESYLHVASDTDFEGALGRFEKRTGKTIDYLILTELRTTPQATLRALLPLRSAQYELVRADAPTVAVFRKVK